MPSYVLICDSCAGHQPFIIYEEELAEIRSGNSIVRIGSPALLRNALAERGVKVKTDEVPKPDSFGPSEQR